MEHPTIAASTMWSRLDVCALRARDARQDDYGRGIHRYRSVPSCLLISRKCFNFFNDRRLTRSNSIVDSHAFMLNSERSRSDGSHDVTGMSSGAWNSTSISNPFSQGIMILANNYWCSFLQYTDLLIDKQILSPFFFEYLKIVTEILARCSQSRLRTLYRRTFPVTGR